MPRGVRRGPAGRPVGSGGDLQGALSGLTAYRDQLERQRLNLAAEIAALDSALSAIGGGPALRGRRPGRPPGRPAARPLPAPRRGRPPRKGSLKEFILKVLSAAPGREMAVKDIATGVVRAGYKSSNKTLAKSVGIALTEIPGVLKVGRGRFRLRG